MITQLDIIDSSAGSFQIGLADEREAGTVLELLLEAADWMHKSGIQQWRREQFTEEVVRSYFATREIYMLVGEQEPVGMFTLQGSDPDYWGSLNDEDFAYLHRLIVRPAYRGQGISRDLIYWAARRSRQLGKKGLRFDCWNENRKLNPYYQELGMVQRGMNRLNGREYVLYEMDMMLFQKI